MELFLPRKWFKSILTLCDRKFEKFLGRAKKRQSRRIRRSLTDDGPRYFDRIRQLRTEKKYFEELETMSRSALIDQVKQCEEEKKQLWKRNEDLEQLILGMEEELMIIDDEPSQDLTKSMNKYEKHIISQQFDHAFHIPDSEPLNKTFHIPD